MKHRILNFFQALFSDESVSEDISHNIAVKIDSEDFCPAEARYLKKSSIVIAFWLILTGILIDVALVLAIWRLLLG